MFSNTKGSQNSKVQSMVRHGTEDLEVGSMDVSSTISERIFERDLSDGKGLESCILVAGAELVVVQILASLTGDSPPTLLEHEFRSPDQVPHKSHPMFDHTPKFFNIKNDEQEE